MLTALTCAGYGSSRVLGHLEDIGAAGGLHAVRAGVRSDHRNPLPTLPETVSFQRRCVPREGVLLRAVQILRGGGGAKLRHRRGILRLLLLADVVRYRDGRQYPDDQDYRIVAKPQTQGN